MSTTDRRPTLEVAVLSGEDLLINPANGLPLSRERRESQVAIEPEPALAARRSAAACYAV